MGLNRALASTPDDMVLRLSCSLMLQVAEAQSMEEVRRASEAQASQAEQELASAREAAGEQAAQLAQLQARLSNKEQVCPPRRYCAAVALYCSF